MNEQDYEGVVSDTAVLNAHKPSERLFCAKFAEGPGPRITNNLIVGHHKRELRLRQIRGSNRRPHLGGWEIGTNGNDFYRHLGHYYLPLVEPQTERPKLARHDAYNHTKKRNGCLSRRLLLHPGE